jgi:ABC-type phosphate/phosphonate transport system substrate-binding protein
MFTARSDLDPALEQQFAKALFGMSFDNPVHRPVLEAEGLREWIAPQLEAYATLREASAQQGFLTRPAA